MPVIRHELFARRDIRTAELAKALAHPARVAILRALARRGECVCGDIVDMVPLAQATVSQHLKELKSVGLIKGEIDGPRVCYCIDAGGVEELSRSLDTLVGGMRACCADNTSKGT